jgi:hypothetical protein
MGDNEGTISQSMGSLETSPNSLALADVCRAEGSTGAHSQL